MRFVLFLLNLQKIDWQLEYKYMNEQILKLKNDCKTQRIKSSENLLDVLIVHFRQRIKVLEKLEQKPSLTFEQRNGIEFLLDRLSNLLTNEGFIDSTNTIFANIEDAKRSIADLNKQGTALKASLENTFHSLEKSMEILRPFNINKLMQHYKQFSSLSSKLENKNVVFFVGRTGSGKKHFNSFFMWHRSCKRLKMQS